MFKSRFMPCRDCGASVDRAAPSAHRCSPARRVDYQMFGLREEIAELEAGMRRYLSSARGRFESWLAWRQVRGHS